MKENKDTSTGMVLSLFSDENKKDLESLLNDIKSVPMGMSEFQINHFVLNRIEYPTDWSKFQQTKLQLHVGIQSLMDMYFQTKEAEANIELAEAIIDELSTSASKVNTAKIKLRQISIEKNRFRISSVQQTAKEKLREILAFYNVFRELKELNNINDNQSKLLEEKTWKIRSMYNPEFKNRYGLTPEGFLRLPHEDMPRKELGGSI